MYLLTQRKLRVPTGRNTPLRFARIEPFKEILAVETNVCLELLEGCQLGQTNHRRGLSGHQNNTII